MLTRIKIMLKKFFRYNNFSSFFVVEGSATKPSIYAYGGIEAVDMEIIAIRGMKGMMYEKWFRIGANL